MTDDVTIELAGPGDVAALAEIERAAGRLFAGWPVALDADPEPTDPEDLAAAQRAGRLWVARSHSASVGFAFVELLDGQPHLEEMDVHPDYGRRNIGTRLLATVEAWARAAGCCRITLTTFREIPWNAPFYARAGFRELAPVELSPALQRVVREEANRGLDPAARVVMCLELSDGE